VHNAFLTSQVLFHQVSSRQEMNEKKFKNREEFCHLAQQQLLTDKNLYQNVLLTDRTTFLNHGKVNARNGLCCAARTRCVLEKLNISAS
jgi:hypothetical protein